MEEVSVIHVNISLILNFVSVYCKFSLSKHQFFLEMLIQSHLQGNFWTWRYSLSTVLHKINATFGTIDFLRFDRRSHSSWWFGQSFHFYPFHPWNRSSFSMQK